MADPAQVPPGGLAAALLDAADALNDALVGELRARGWPPLTRTRALAFRYLAAGVTRPAGLARQLDLTRQSVQKLLDGLERDGLIARRPDPDDARAQIVELTADGDRMLDEAGRVLRSLEREVEARLGRDGLTALRRLVPRVAPTDRPG
jgi:DNA-binding MarR family transcriptional regulator